MATTVMARGFNWRDGHGQYSERTMRNAIDDDTIMTNRIIQMYSTGSKCGRQVGYKRDFADYLRKNMAYGDYSAGARHPYYEDLELDPGQGDGQWTQERRRKGTVGKTDTVEEAMQEINNRMGEQIYGYQQPDMAKVAEETSRHNARLVGGENIGYGSHEAGLYQAGHNRLNWEQGPKRNSDYDTDPNKVTHDHVRATMISAPLRSYDPRTLWIGSGHMPGSKRMREIPFAV